MIYADFNTVDGACGVGIAYDFRSKEIYGVKEITEGTPGGAGLLCAGFLVDDAMSNEAFALLSEKYKVEYVSPSRKNVNSGNMFYFAVFDCEEAGVPIGYDQFDGMGF